MPRTHFRVAVHLAFFVSLSMLRPTGGAPIELGKFKQTQFQKERKRKEAKLYLAIKSINIQLGA